jgi:glutamate racemase
VANAPNIILFDSGLGGLTVYREVVGALPGARYLYVADDAFFPYGGRDEGVLIARLLELMGGLIATQRPDLVIIACNTASTLVLPQLRTRFEVPFIGTVPAIKPACAASVSKRVSVLGTQSTIAREYTKALIRDFANGADITLVGSGELAALAEAQLRGEAVDDAAIAAELNPCFVEADGRRTDTVVLACTHYPLLLDRLTRLAPWPVRFIDPAPAIARRALELMGTPLGTPPAAPAGERARILFTSGREPSPALAAALAGFGLGQIAPDGGLSDPGLTPPGFPPR